MRSDIGIRPLFLVIMIMIRFPARTTGRKALAEQNIPFSVKGKATYEQQVAAIRGAASP